MRSKSLLRTTIQPIAIAIGLAVVVRCAVQLYSIPTASMAPTLEPGDQIVVTPYFRSMPERGHVVVFEHDGELLVKRVVAVPGDLIDSRLGRVRIGGYTLPEPYVLRQAATGSIPAQIVASETYFVLGDNRDDSLDSRSWGLVPREQIVGRARMVLWSSSPLGETARALGSRGGSSHRAHGPERLFKWIE